jgi:SAM-dependent methyltransferase
VLPSDFAFDALAADYDTQFTHSRIGTFMRQAVWQRLDGRFRPGQRVLELNCGTGEDAIHLGQQGVRVLATDLSREMVAITRRKVARTRLTATVRVQQLAVEHLHELEAPPFEGVLSNFGGLNCVADLSGVGCALAARLQPGALAFLCVMGPLVPWEWGWFLAHGDPGTAFRRLRPGGVAWRDLTIHYPSIRTLRRAFSPAFRLCRASAIGALLPPPFTESRMVRHPRLLAFLNRWERRLEALPPLPWLADHYLLELERV